jgi:hypothetical protein
VKRRHRRSIVSESNPLVLNESHHLWDDKELYRLTLSNASHSKGALSVVTESHIFAQRQCSSSINALVNIHAGRVNLVVEREAAMWRAAALI